MSYCVRRYPGEGDPDAEPVMLTESHGSLGEAQIDAFGRAARWWDERKEGRKVTAPDNKTAICWQDGKIAFILVVEPNKEEI